MASKKDLVEGQSFSRRRLITAFVSGAPGGREVEPGKPLRAVVGGVMLSAILVVGALAVGLLAPTLPDGWDQNSLVIAEDTGARYVAINGTLYPVINTASARLMIPAEFKVVSADADKLVDSDKGPTRGIIGAPDALPGPSALIDTGWTSCTSRNRGVTTTISATPNAGKVVDRAVIATVGGAEPASYLVDNGLRYEIPPDDLDAVKRILELDTAPSLEVTAPWINLFAAGPDIAPFAVPGAGTTLAGVSGLPNSATVGSVLTDESKPDRPYLLLAGGRIAPLTPFAAALYSISTDTSQAPEVSVSSAVAGGLGNADPIWPSAWPTVVPGSIDQTPCAVLTSAPGGTLPAIALGVSTASAPDDESSTTNVDAGAGALIRAIGAASPLNGPVYLIDQTGSYFPIEGTADDAPVARLGYGDGDIVAVPQAWLALLEGGPTLSVAAAGATVTAATGR